MIFPVDSYQIREKYEGEILRKKKYILKIGKGLVSALLYK